MEELETMREIYDFPPELDFYSDEFDPVCALNSYIHLPYPNAKTYNNLAEYYSHTFLKKEDRKRVEKDRPYDRDYSYYYATLGINKRAQERYERRRLNKIKNMKYAGWRSAKLKKKLPTLCDDPNREPCRSYPPLQSTKIIQVDSALRKRKIFPITKPPDICSEANLLSAFMGNETNDDKGSTSHQDGKKPSGVSIDTNKELRPQTSTASSADHFTTNNSRHQQRIFENSSYNCERKYENRYRQHSYNNNVKESRNSQSRKDAEQEICDPRLRRNKRK